MDEKKIKEICGDVGRMDFEDASEAAKQLEDGDFLPQLKFDALKELEQRMSKIKTDECELLVSKLLNAFDEAGVTESKRCHFYPILSSFAAPLKCLLCISCTPCFFFCRLRFLY